MPATPPRPPARQAVSLRDAVAHAKTYGLGVDPDVDSVIRRAAAMLVDIYDDHDLHSVERDHSGADDAAALYHLLTSVGLEVP